MQSQYLISKLETVVFYLLIFAVPVQARVILHKWTEPFNQWTSAYLYGTDILLAAILFLWLIRSCVWDHVWKFNFQTLRSSTPKLLRNSYFWLMVFFIVSALSIFNSHVVSLSFYQLLKLTEFIGFYFYLRQNFGKIFQFRTILAVMVASGLFQSIIAIAQYLKQESVGLRLFGESPLSVNTTGVAIFFADGEQFLRAYGTAPHPNILAAWLFVAIFAFYFLYLCRDKLWFSQDHRWWLGVYIVLLLGFFFTFSRVIIGLWALGLVIRFAIVFLKKEFRQNKILKRRMLNLFAVSVIITAVFSLIYWPQVSSRIHISAQDPAFYERVYYNKIAKSAAVSNPLLGVGIGQFVPDFMSQFKHLPHSVYQPVHNLYLLIASETGFLGLTAFFLFIFFSFWQFLHRADFKKLHAFSFLIFNFSFLMIGLFDHFLWTSQQGSLIFWMVLAFLGAEQVKNRT